MHVCGHRANSRQTILSTQAGSLSVRRANGRARVKSDSLITIAVNQTEGVTPGAWVN
ncbi:MAG TPA: hypothetical protein PL001_05935 [Candidatus Kryptobacter bacterium]|nr:hypothetical protein [Candidatus Kryptobacter bacterium]